MKSSPQLPLLIHKHSSLLFIPHLSVQVSVPWLPAQTPTFTMKFLVPLTVLIAGVFAAPAPAPADLETRQLFGSDTSNDFVNGGCKGHVMIYARASSESGNIVSIRADHVCRI